MSTKGKGRKPRPKKSINKPAIDELLVSLKGAPKFVRMIDYSVECLCKMAVDDVSAEEIIECGTIEVMMEIVAKNPGNEKVQAAMNRLITSLSRNEELAKMIADRLNGNFNPFCQSLREHKEPATVISSCDAIAALCKHKPNMEAIKRCKVLDSLASVCQRFSDNPEVLAAAARCMANFAPQKDNALTLLRNGGVQSVLNGCIAHPHDLELQKAAARLIAALCESMDPEVLDLLRKMGAVDVLVSALENHPFDEELEADATIALKALTGAHDMDLLLKILSGDTCQDLRTANAMAKLAALLLAPDNVDYLFKHDGIAILLAALRSALANDNEYAARIVNNALRALARAAAGGNEKDIYSIIKGGGVQLILSAMKKYMDDEAVCESAILGLNKMLTRGENAVFIGKNGGPKMVGECLIRHPNSAPIARAAVDFYGGMGKWDESGQMAVAAGAIEALVEMIKRHHKKAPTVAGAIASLGNYANNEENLTRMAKAGLLESLLQALQEHPHDKGVVSRTLQMIEALALVRKNAEDFEKLGAIGIIHDVMDVNEGDGEIQKLGQAAIDAIQGYAIRMAAEKLAAEEAEKARLQRIEEERLRRLEAEKRRLAEIQRAKEEADRKRKEEEEAMRMELDMLAALDLMKQEEEDLRLARLAEERERKRREDEAARLENERLAREARERARREREEAEKKRLADAEQARLMALVNQSQQAQPAAQPVKLKKSARDLFDSDDEGSKKKLRKKMKLDPAIKDFLLAGMMLTKHSKTAAPRKRHLYMTPDCSRLCWKAPGKKELQPSQQMRIPMLASIEEGRCTPVLNRKTMFGGKYLAPNEDLCFAIFGGVSSAKSQTRMVVEKAHEEERSVNFEASSVSDVQKWVAAINHLVEWIKSNKLVKKNQANMVGGNKLNDANADGTKLMGYEDSDSD